MPTNDQDLQALRKLEAAARLAVRDDLTHVTRAEAIAAHNAASALSDTRATQMAFQAQQQAQQKSPQLTVSITPRTRPTASVLPVVQGQTFFGTGADQALLRATGVYSAPHPAMAAAAAAFRTQQPSTGAPAVQNPRGFSPLQP